MYNNSKKGVSPLIATVLTMVIVVSIGAVVMNWSRIFISDKLDAASDTDTSFECANFVNLAFQKIGGQTQAFVCDVANADGTRNASITIENKGTAGTITNFRYTISGREGIDQNEITSSSDLDFIPGDAEKWPLTFNSTKVGEVTQVKLIPYFIPKDSEVEGICGDSVLTIDFPKNSSSAC